MSCTWGADGWSGLDGTTWGRRQPHRAEDPGLTPDAQGGAAEALRTPAPCVRSTLPPCPATFLSLAQASTSGQRRWRRGPWWTQKRGVVFVPTWRRGRLPEPSAREHRLASVANALPTSGRGVVSADGCSIYSPPSSRATPTAELCAPGARALGSQSGRHRRRDQREERRGQQEPHIALSAHLRTWHSPLTNDLRHPTSHLTGGARRLTGQDGSSAAVHQLTTSMGVLRHRPRRGWRLALSLRSPAPPSAGMLGWGGRGVAGGAGWPAAWPLATRLGWARGL